MAKVSFNKLGIKKVNDEVAIIPVGEEKIEVKQYLPVEEKLKLISAVIENSNDGNRFLNHMKFDVHFNYAVICAYTNITFTDKQKEDIYKLMDLFMSSSLLELILHAIPDSEYNSLKDEAYSTALNIYTQINSAYGIMENIAADYSNLEMDATKINKELSNPNNLTLLKDVMTKLG